MRLEHTWLRQAMTEPVSALSVLEDGHLGMMQPYGEALRRVAARLGDHPMLGVTPELLWAEVGEADRARLTELQLGEDLLVSLHAKGSLTPEESTYLHSRLREERARHLMAQAADTMRLGVALQNPADLVADLFRVLDEAQRVLAGGTKEYLRGEEIADYAVGMLADYYAQGGHWDTGIPELDRLLGGGVRPGQLIILGAWPSHGKSLLAQAIADGLTARNPEAGEAYFFDCEMGVPTVVGRVVQRIMHSSPTRAPTLDGALQLLTPHLGRIAGSRVIVGSPRTLTLAQAVRHSQMAVAMGCRVIVWDGGHILKVPGKDNRQQELEEITRTAKAFAREHDVVLILTGQLNQDRPPQNGALMRAPERQDFKGGRSFTEDADYAILLRRVDKQPCIGDTDHYGVHHPDDLRARRGLTWFKLAKNRHNDLENEVFSMTLDSASLRYDGEMEATSPLNHN